MNGYIVLLEDDQRPQGRCLQRSGYTRLPHEGQQAVAPIFPSKDNNQFQFIYYNTTMLILIVKQLAVITETDRNAICQKSTKLTENNGHTCVVTT